MRRRPSVRYGAEPADDCNRPQADVVRMRTDGYGSSYTDLHSHHQCSVRRYDRLVCNVVVDASAEATRVQTPRV